MLRMRRWLPLIAIALTGSQPTAPAAEPGLTLAWEKNMLTIRGALLPGGELKVWYLEAFCRPGSTDREWKETVIPHKTALVKADPENHWLKLKSTLADGVTVDHELRAGGDEVTFRVVAANPTDRASEAAWAQPCIKVDKFTGVAAEARFRGVPAPLVRLPRRPPDAVANAALGDPGTLRPRPGLLPRQRRSQRRQSPASQHPGPLERLDGMLLRR